MKYSSGETPEVGDVVECVDNREIAHRLVRGEKYTVLKIGSDGLIQVSNVPQRYLVAARFRLLSREPSSSSLDKAICPVWEKQTLRQRLLACTKMLYTHDCLTENEYSGIVFAVNMQSEMENRDSTSTQEKEG